MSNKYGWVKSPENPDDVYVENHAAFKLTAEPIPDKIDLRQYCSPVFDQKNIGSCTGNALVGALEYLENKDKDLESNGQFCHLSRLFVYYNEREVEGTVSQDAGAHISDGIKVLSEEGACSETVWPYDEKKFTIKPTVEAYQDGLTRKISGYAKVNQDLDSIKKVLASGYPIVFGFTVYPSFESEDVADSGEVDMPGIFEKAIGGHAVLLVGFKDSTKKFIVRNSWGPDWGDNGYFTLPYKYVIDPKLACDFWTITK